MTDAEDKHWATRVVIDPLTEPEPSSLDGPGTHFTQSSASATSPTPTSAITSESRKSTNPFRRSSGATNTTGHDRHDSIEKPEPSVSSRQVSSSSHGSRRNRASSDLRHDAVRNENRPNHRAALHSRQGSEEIKNRPRRSSSLRQRYPGDPTDHPLDMLKKDDKLAHRSPHLRKHHQPLPDPVDVLDKSTFKYHHEGPYDAALLVRNSSYNSSPVAALKITNGEAIKATPKDKIKDSLHDHRPLDGTAIVPPGHRDVFGQLYEYEEGTDLMREPGADYKRWPGIQYHPDDLKGKGEPSYSIEKALKDHDEAAKRHGSSDKELELVERPKPAGEPEIGAASGQNYGEWETGRRSSHAHKLSDGIKRRVGSLRKKDH